MLAPERVGNEARVVRAAALGEGLHLQREPVGNAGEAREEGTKVVKAAPARLGRRPPEVGWPELIACMAVAFALMWLVEWMCTALIYHGAGGVFPTWAMLLIVFGQLLLVAAILVGVLAAYDAIMRRKRDRYFEALRQRDLNELDRFRVHSTRRRPGWNWPVRTLPWRVETRDPEMGAVLYRSPYRDSFYTRKPFRPQSRAGIDSIYTSRVGWDVWERFRQGKQRRRALGKRKARRPAEVSARHLVRNSYL
jgi:hypothetical protein